MRYGIALVVMLLGITAHAARTAAPNVSPVEKDGIRYVAPNSSGRTAYLEAWDIQSSNRLWQTVVFMNRISPWLEEDVQWVFIKKLSIADGMILVRAERGKEYLVDAKTGHVKSRGYAIQLLVTLSAVVALGVASIIARKRRAIGIGTPLAERPSHTTDRTDRVYGGSAGEVGAASQGTSQTGR